MLQFDSIVYSIRPRWAPCWPHELCYLGIAVESLLLSQCRVMFRHQDHHSSAYCVWWSDIYQCKLSSKIWILYRKQHKSTKDTICVMHIWQQSSRLLQLISADHHGACHMDTQWHRIYYSLRPSDEYMHQQNGLSLVQVLACCQILNQSQLDP